MVQVIELGPYRAPSKKKKKLKVNKITTFKPWWRIRKERRLK